MKNQLMVATGIALTLASCKSDVMDTATPPVTGSPTTGLAPVETNPPNTTYRPAFAGQTRVAGVRSVTKYQSTVLTTALGSPWGIAQLPDGRFLITEKAGNMRIVTTAGQVSAPLNGVPAVNSNGQGGLLGLCVDPNFTTNRLVYWTFSESRPDGNLLAVAKGRLSSNETSLEGVTVIYRATPAYSGVNQYGSRVIFEVIDNNRVVGEERLLTNEGQRFRDITQGLDGALYTITDGGRLYRIDKQ